MIKLHYSKKNGVAFSINIAKILKWKRYFWFITNVGNLFRFCDTNNYIDEILPMFEDEKIVAKQAINMTYKRDDRSVTSNYNNYYIPYSSLEKALGLLNKDAEVFKKESEEDEDIDLDDLFEESE